MVKVVVNNGQYKITIPKDIALAKGWNSETRLMVIMNAEGDIVLKEIKDKGGSGGSGGTISSWSPRRGGKSGK